MLISNIRIPRRIKALGTVIATVLFLVAIFHITIDPELPLSEKIQYFDFLTDIDIGWSYFKLEDSFRESNLKVRSLIHYKKKEDHLFNEFVLGNEFKYKDFVTKNKGSNELNFDFASWDAIDLDERCNHFFTNWKDKNPNWSFDKFDRSYDKSIIDKKSFYEHRKRQRIDQMINNKVPVHKQKLSKNDEKKINEEFESTISSTFHVQNEMVKTMSLTRIFGKCFVNNPSKNKNMELYSELSRKLFPYYKQNFPVFEHINGAREVNKFPGSSNLFSIEIESEDKEDKKTDKQNPSEMRNILDYIKQNCHGKGIAILVSTKYARETIKLIRILRALNNKLPIEIFHKEDLSVKNMNFIKLAATVSPEDSLDEELSTEYKKVYPEIDLKNDYKSYGSEFPIQDVTFVNLRHVLERDYNFLFPGFANKLLALQFTSFKDVLLLDADTVPLVNLELLFDSDEYKTTGTYFFRDRSLRDHNNYLETNYFILLMPTIEGYSLDRLFGIPLVTDHTLGNPYLTGWRHHQEAGIVAIDKSKHFMGIATTLSLTLWSEPIKSSIWGDKELYWLGLSIMGDENYSFNKYGAASVGELISNPDHKYYLNTDSHELCSTHPGHINEDGELLWINSGFAFCKKNGQFRDRNRFPLSVLPERELFKLFDLPLKITHAIVPPDLPALRPVGGVVDDTDELMFIEEWNLRPKDMDQINDKLLPEDPITNQIKDWNPQKGWVKSPICGGYYYCAYNIVEGYSTFKNGVDQKTSTLQRGHFFEFSEEKVKFYKYFAKLWATGVPKFRQPTTDDVERAREEDEERARMKIEMKEAAERTKKLTADNELPIDDSTRLEVLGEVQGNT